MAEFKTVDNKGNEVVINEKSFQLCQTDEKLHDNKMESKPTTFLKDAFKRFCKNKSSVVAAFIIGILILLAIVIPVFSIHDVDNPEKKLELLPPRIREASNGFWDGTQKYERIPMVFDTQTPAGFRKESIVKIYNTYTEYTTNPTEYSHGGSFQLRSDSLITDGLTYEQYIETTNRIMYAQHREAYNYTANGGYALKIVLNSTDNISDGKLAEYRILLYSQDRVVVLQDWSTDYSDVEINISDKLREANYNSLEGRVRIELKQRADTYTYLLIDNLEITTELGGAFAERVATFSITDGSRTAMLPINNESGAFNPGYWSATAVKGVYNAEITYVDFLYDVYDAKLGRHVQKIGKSEIDAYIANGWCTFFPEIGVSTFTVTSDECPIVEVYSIERINVGSISTYQIECSVDLYKYIGYDSMPNFILGTNNEGFDLLTMCFRGLLTSLLLAIATSAICFLFGLVWGSVSGYFGGNVDIFMERFCEILSGVPWIVVMTLAILLLGNNIVTFGLALCLTGWMGTAARTRTQFYRFKGREYILASRTLGATDMRLIFKHILPNSMGTIITSSVLMIPSVIFSEATLSYLNLGLQGSNSFGNILSKNQTFLGSRPILILFPAFIISLLMISFNLFGNGLRDAFNPSLKGNE